jgi:hypothetical protein
MNARLTGSAQDIFRATHVDLRHLTETTRRREEDKSGVDQGIHPVASQRFRQRRVTDVLLAGNEVPARVGQRVHIYANNGLYIRLLQKTSQ